MTPGFQLHHPKRASVSRFSVGLCGGRVRSRLITAEILNLPDIPWEPGALHPFDLLMPDPCMRTFKANPMDIGGTTRAASAYWTGAYAPFCLWTKLRSRFGDPTLHKSFR